MKSEQGYRVLPFTANRRMAAASAAVCRERDTIHTITEVDITEPRRLIHEHRERTGERLSLTAYVVACLARTVTEFPEFNAIRIGGRLRLCSTTLRLEPSLSADWVAQPSPSRWASQLRTS